MFLWPFEDDTKMIMILYVDDIILTGDNIIEMERLMRSIATKFEVKVL